MGTNVLDVRPLSGALGAEILGIDLAHDLGEETVAAVRAAWLEHLVIFFRQQTTQSLVDAILMFESLEDRFLPAFIRASVETFDISRFKFDMGHFIKAKMQEFQSLGAPVKQNRKVATASF